MYVVTHGVSTEENRDLFLTSRGTVRGSTVGVRGHTESRVFSNTGGTSVVITGDLFGEDFYDWCFPFPQGTFTDSNSKVVNPPGASSFVPVSTWVLRRTS